MFWLWWITQRAANVVQQVLTPGIEPATPDLLLEAGGSDLVLEPNDAMLLEPAPLLELEPDVEIIHEHC